MGVLKTDIGNVKLGNVANTIVRDAAVVPSNMPDPGRNLRLAASALTEWAAAAEKIGDCFGMMKGHRDKELTAQAEAMKEKDQYLSDCANGKLEFNQSTVDGYNKTIKSNSFWNKPEPTETDRELLIKARMGGGLYDSIPDMMSAPSGFGS